MPPRHAYWTILIDDHPTAFRAREREELLPTFHQLQRKNTNIAMQWFARGRLWSSRETEQEDFQRRKRSASAPFDRAARPPGDEKRGGDWRPGGAHKDPRDRFKKKNRPERAWSDDDVRRDREKRPWQYKPGGPPRGAGADARRSSQDRAGSSGDRRDRPPRNQDARQGYTPAGPRDGKSSSVKPPTAPGSSDRPWQTKPTGPRKDRKPWQPKPPNGPPRGDGRDAHRRPPDHGSKPSVDTKGSGGGWRDKKPGGAPHRDRAWSGKPPALRPWAGRLPAGPPRGDRPWNAQPKSDRPWTNKPPADLPRQQNRKPLARGPQGRRPPLDAPPRKRRDDEPSDS